MQPPAYRDSHPTASSMETPLAAIRKTLPLRVLSDEDWRHWTTNGYVIVRQAVPTSNVERLVDVLWRFDEKDPDDPATWFAPLRPLPIGVQGVLSLSNQDREVGGFPCVPELFNNFDEWVKTQPADRDPMHPDVTGLDVVYVGLEPGDLLIFNSLLAHGVRPNRSDNRVRIAQYISMYPADWDDTAEREDRIRQWREMDHPHRDAFPGDPRDWEKHHTTTATLTPLGEKLLGLTRW